MMDVGEEIFWKNASGTLRDIGMTHLDPAHGAAVDAVRWCLVVRGRPTNHRQSFLETECPTLLAYLEKLATSGDAAGWRTLEMRIRHYAELLHETDVHPCPRPWLAAIWHTLPELAAIGRTILDGTDDLKSVADFEVSPASADANKTVGDGGDDKGSAGKAGSAGTTARPKSSPRLILPVVAVILTEAEMKTLALGDDATTENEAVSDSPDGTSDIKPRGPK